MKEAFSSFATSSKEVVYIYIYSCRRILIGTGSSCLRFKYYLAPIATICGELTGKGFKRLFLRLLPVPRPMNSRHAIQLFQRVTLNMDMPPSVKSTMTQTLASSVLQAQQHLSLAAPPPMNPLAQAMMNQSMVPQHQPQQHQPNVTLGLYPNQFE